MPTVWTAPMMKKQGLRFDPAKILFRPIRQISYRTEPLGLWSINASHGYRARVTQQL